MRLALGEAIGQLIAKLLDVLDAAPHQTLDRQHGIQRVDRGGRLGLIPHLDMIGVVADGGRQDHPPGRIGQRRGQAAAHGSNQRIGGTQVDAHGQAALMGLRALPGLGDLQ